MQNKRNGSIASRLFSGGLWVLAGRALIGLSAVAINVLLARILTPSELGNYFIIVSITLVGSTIAQFGTQPTIVKVIAGNVSDRRQESIAAEMNGILFIAFLATLMTAGGYVLGIGTWIGEGIFGSSLIAGAVNLTAVWIALKVLEVLLSQFFRGFHDIGMASLLDRALNGFLLMIALGMVYAIGAPFSLENALLVSIYILAATTLFGITVAMYYHGKYLFATNMELKRVFQISSPIFVSSIMFLGLGEAHLWILGANRPDYEVAIYGSAYRLVQLVVIPSLILKNSVQSSVAELYAQRDFKKLEKVLRTGATIAGVPTCVACICLALTGEFALSLVFGKYYAQGAQVLMVLSLAQTFHVALGIPGVLLTMADHQVTVMRTTIISGASSVIISILLVDSLGALGVSIGLALGLILNKVLLAYACLKMLNVKTHIDVLSIPGLTRRALKGLSESYVVVKEKWTHR